jgi:peptide-methionine (S)-S-oxide reductase
MLWAPSTKSGSNPATVTLIPHLHGTSIVVTASISSNPGANVTKALAISIPSSIILTEIALMLLAQKKLRKISGSEITSFIVEVSIIMDNIESKNHLEVATLSSGCFWCAEAVFQEIKGIMKVEPGYSGGSMLNPTYEQVSTGTTGHAEAVQITFDPSIISFRKILEIFFATHDPTTPNRQGADVGHQYRSAIFYHNDEQKATTEEVIKELISEKIFNSPIITEVKPFKAFYKAEDYHKNYFKKHPQQPYCRVVISPKIKKLRKKFQDELKSS